VSHLAVGSLLYVSGTCAVKDGRPFRQGVVGASLSLAEGYEAARYALLPTLGVIQYALGDLDRVTQAVQMTGFVNSAPGFSDQPRVINGATDLLVELFGERGKPTRAAIGCQGLALGHSVEIVLTVLFSGSEVRPPLHRDAHAR
jgi:enamine deaminase RidA (YjgF/YER057c/UK114 family)